VRFQTDEQTLRFRVPFAASYGTLTERRVIGVALTGADGVTGFGEAAPLEPYDGVSLEAVRQALERCRVLLEAADAEDRPREQLLERCRQACALPQALAAIDLALWDIEARRGGVSLAVALSQRTRPTAYVSANAVISATDPGAVAAQAEQAWREGHTCIKLKVGGPDDESLVWAAREAVGPEVGLRLDANGAWTVQEAVAAIESLRPAGLELVEEPTHGLVALREVREAVSVPVAIDETAAQDGAIESGAADAVCLKLSRCGGPTGLLADARRARECGMDVYLASTLDGPIGLAGTLHAAAAIGAPMPLRACGLATLGLFEDHGDELPVRFGAMAVPKGPGLGIPAGRALSRTTLDA
jgi:L-alanine-DL-glutamate epimerase-like enolase superfamily enzyme